MTKKIKHTDLSLTPDVRHAIDLAYDRILNASTFILGAEVEAFEAEWAEYNNTRYCIAVGNGFDGLQLCLRTQGAAEDRSVIVPAFTAPPVWSAVLSLNSIPVVYEEGAYAFASISVNLYGERAPLFDTDFKIEDASQSHGLPPNKDADATVHSFYPTKNLGALGDGGSILTNSEPLAVFLRSLHNYGTNGAVNSRLDTLQAAFLRAKLPYLNTWNARRLENACAYDSLLRDTPLHLPDINAESVWHQYAVLCTDNADRDALRAYLADNGIETLIHYPVPPHLLFNTHKLAAEYHALPQSLHDAEDRAQRTLSLPIGPHITRKDIETITEFTLHYYENLHSLCR